MKLIVTCDRSVDFSGFRHNSFEILLKVALNAINQTKQIMIDKAVVIHLKIHKNERKRLYQSHEGFNLLKQKFENNHSLCLNFFHQLAGKPNLEIVSNYSNKFFHNFHLSESSFTCPRQSQPSSKFILTKFQVKIKSQI
jgi:hypothetical protein